MAGMTVPQLGDQIGKGFMVHSDAALWYLSCNSKILALIPKQHAPDKPARLTCFVYTGRVLHWTCTEATAKGARPLTSFPHLVLWSTSAHANVSCETVSFPSRLQWLGKHKRNNHHHCLRMFPAFSTLVSYPGLLRQFETHLILFFSIIRCLSGRVLSQ
jgi:hypothetical protein